MRRFVEVVPEEGADMLDAGATGGPGPAIPGLPPGVPEKERQRSLKWAIRIGAGGLVAVWLFNLTAYVQVRAWQMLVLIAAGLVSAVGLFVSNWLASRGRLPESRNVLMAAMVLLFVSGELVHAGLTWYLVGGGVVLILLLGIALVPGRAWVWALMASAYAGYVALVNRLEPLPRFDVGQLGLHADLFVIALLGFLVVAVLFLIANFYQRLMSIRIRLPVGFVLVLLGSVAVIATVLAVVGSQGGRRQAMNQLESVARMKEAEIDQWIGRVERSLDETLADGQLAPHLVMILENQETTDAELAYPQSYLLDAAQDSDYFDDFALLAPDGRVRLFTAQSSEESEVVREEDLRKGLEGFHLQPLLYAAERYRAPMVAMRPIFNGAGQPVGVLAGIVDIRTLSDLLGERAWLGETGEIYLIDRHRRLLTDLRFSHLHRILINTQLEARAVGEQADGAMVYTDYHGEQVVGVAHWLPQLEGVLVAKQDTAEAVAVTNELLRAIALVSGAASVAAVAVSMRMTRSITEPLAELTGTAERIAGGDLSLVPALSQRDEIGALGHAFARMTAQVRELIGTLEARVAERTTELERRSAYLEASAEVGRAASSILDPHRLMAEVVELIRDRFGLYYVGLFLVDESGQWAVLRAGTGLAGEVMLSRGHRIEIGKGLVGWSVANAEWRVVQETGQEPARDRSSGSEPVRLATPELPATRSEAALPLRSRGQVLGAITVQHTEPGAFDPDALVVLQTMADQVAVAIDNARLFAESQRALEAEQQAYGVVSRQAWQRMIQAAAVRGYRCDHVGVMPASGELPPLSKQAVAERRVVVTGPATRPGSEDSGHAGLGRQDARAEVAVPIIVRDQVLGVLHFRQEEGDDSPWSREQIALIQGLAEQLGQAFESARLYRDSQLRAGRERVAAEVTTRVRETLDIETVMKTAAVEIREALDLPAVSVRLRSAPRRTADVGTPDEVSRVPETGGKGDAARDNGDGE